MVKCETTTIHYTLRLNVSDPDIYFRRKQLRISKV